MKFRKMVIAFIIGCFLLAAINVYAATSPSPYQYATVFGYEYKYRSSVSSDSESAWSGTFILLTEGNATAGYFGANARLYDSSGTLLKSSGWYYNDEELAGLSNLTDSYYGKGTFYGKGQVRMYNGDGYNTYTTYSTPYTQVMSINETITYSVNSNGQIYGSEYFLNIMGVEPDLIQAQGQSGVLGYIKAEDIGDDYVPSSPSAAIDYQNSLPNERVIPLYASDGITVIDTFVVSYENIETIE
ncbi:hypothetical protein DW1_0625 [Proteiniborus sp. DW1]|uniref:hypothetical protein n=1 Tax=Proteiniborus sp. DW1 TaxID=1889883 RepID=UPI00092DFC59|nr:hypothetical protein [Proteiniborus sp. DW1]SCG82234.1 hypothetical protein DW1_0625 [Proteiniborus sp. DW1]